ncbi:MAG: hypothetical protein FWD65_01550 [Coriobacteriia bacterium]|nr:hypothetical protein [Coriobacteriia bacterium]
MIRDIERLAKKDLESADTLQEMIRELEKRSFELLAQNRWRRLSGKCNLELRPLKCKKVLRVLAVGYPPGRFEKFILLDLYEAHGGKRQQIDPSTLKQANRRARECLEWLKGEGALSENH